MRGGGLFGDDDGTSDLFGDPAPAINKASRPQTKGGPSSAKSKALFGVCLCFVYLEGRGTGASKGFTVRCTCTVVVAALWRVDVQVRMVAVGGGGGGGAKWMDALFLPVFLYMFTVFFECLSARSGK